MTVTYEKNFDFDLIIAGVEEKVYQTLGQALEDAKDEIQVRTAQGQSVDGSEFDSYSKGYAKYREKHGRNATPVDLELTGNMQRAMQTGVDVNGDQVVGEIFFDDSSSVAPGRSEPVSARDKARWNDATRPFFSLTQEQANSIEEKLKKAIDDI